MIIKIDDYRFNADEISYYSPVGDNLIEIILTGGNVKQISFGNKNSRDYVLADLDKTTCRGVFHPILPPKI